MTLDTHIVVHEPLAVRRVFDYCRKLIGAGDDHWFEHRTEPGEYDTPATFNPSWNMRPGQGLPAWLMVDYGPDGPLRRNTSYDDPEEAELYQRPEGFIEVSFDTAYGYGRTSPNGASCSDLHAWLVRELGRWLEDQGATWTWENEFTGEWFKGYDGLDAFGNADRGALFEVA